MSIAEDMKNAIVGTVKGAGDVGSSLVEAVSQVAASA